MNPQDLALVALRATLLYFYLLFVIRVLGKREVGNFTAFDLIVALMLGEIVDEIIFGNVSLVKGFLAVTIIGAWHFVNSWASFKSKFIDKITGAAPSVLIDKGKILHDALAKERFSEDDLWAELRLNGIDDLKEVKQATMEPNGQVSVLKEEWAKPIQKSDLPGGENKNNKPAPAKQQG